MTQISSNLEEQTTDRINIHTIIIGGLLFFILWQSSGMNLFGGSSEEFRGAGVRYQESEEAAAGGATIIDILPWFVFACVGIFLHVVNKNRALFTWARAWPLVVLLAIIALSVLWSLVPDIALRRVVKQLLLIAIVAGVVMGATSPRQIVLIAALIMGVMMGLNVVAVLMFSNLAEIKGLHAHKNGAGIFAMVSVFVWLTAARWSSGTLMRAGLYSGTLLWFLFLLATNARTAIISTIAAILLIIPLRYCLRRPVAGALFGICTIFVSLCAAYVFIAFNISFSDVIAFVEGEHTTLTGRARVWHIAYNAYLEHRLLGTGYGSLWLTGDLAPVEKYTNLLPNPFLLGLNQAHSGYFDILATLGLVGAAAFFVLLASIVGKNLRVLASVDKGQDDPLLAELTGLIFFASLLSNLTETSFLRGGILWVFLVLCYLMLCSIRFPTIRGSSLEFNSASPPASHIKPLQPVSRMNP